MNAEQEPREAGQIERQEIGQQPLRFVAEGNGVNGPILPSGFNISIEGGQAAQSPFPSPSPRPERQPSGGGNHWKAALLGVGALAAAAAIGAGAAFGVGREKNSDEDPQSSGVPESTITQVDSTPTATATPIESTSTPEPTKVPEAKLPYTYVNPVTEGKVTLDVTEGMLTRKEGPSNVYSGRAFETVEYYPLSGIEFNPAMEGAAENVEKLFEYELLRAYSQQENIPEEQKDIIIQPTDTNEVKLQKLQEFQDRLARGETFDYVMRANQKDSFVAEDVEFTLDKDWKYFIDEVDKPTPFITWQEDGRTGIRIEPDAKQLRVELFYRYAGAQGLWSEKINLSTELARTLHYMSELTKSQKSPDLLTPSSPTQQSQRNSILGDIGIKWVIPDADPGEYGNQWSDGALHPIP